MADESTFSVPTDMSLYYYVDRGTQEVAAIYLYNIFGITAMDKESGDWRAASRDEQEFSDLVNGDYDVYSYDWESEDYSDDDMVSEETDDWTPKSVSDWASGKTVTAEDIKSHTRKLDETFISAEEAAELPGE